MAFEVFPDPAPADIDGPIFIEVTFTSSGWPMSDAIERANELLASCLSSEQLAMWRKEGRFIVDGKYHRYEIGRGNVILIDAAGRAVGSMCCLPLNSGYLPRSDVIAAQKLAIDAYEDYFLSIGRFSTIATTAVYGCDCDHCEMARGKIVFPPTTKVYEPHALTGGV